ncbi:MAG TPA: PilX N-terminal domain-containing pilus assembly protein [Rhodocyclaceae bacterium]|nr:PilX N-terminal domain-containing pilus assembly protein [Rhodocyclaceae bacterium]
MMNHRAIHSAERGSVLIIGLIMLVVMTLLAVSAIRMSTMSLRALNGAQARSEAQWAAQNAIDQVLNTNFAANLGAVAGNYTVAVDAGKSYTVAVGTPCLKQMQFIKNTELKTTDAEDMKCYDTTTNPYSACSTTVWQVNATASEGFLGVSSSVVQGVSIRMDTSSALAYYNSSSPSYICP